MDADIKKRDAIGERHRTSAGNPVDLGKQRMRRKHVGALHRIVGVAVLALIGFAVPKAHAQLQCDQKITVAPVIPKDECKGAFKNTPENAAIFAWDSFIALNWPALPGKRDTPDTSKIFGPDVSPVVWETMRAKVEIYPGNGNLKTGPHGAVLDSQAPFKPTNPPDFGYDDGPDYVYSPFNVGTSDGRVAACTGQPRPAQPAWVPLDETTQIQVNQTFASVLSASDPTGNNSAPQLIRYMVKANRVLYSYIVQNQFWFKGPPLTSAMTRFQTALAQGQTQDPAEPFVQFSPPLPDPAGNSSNTIELKAAWRPLTSQEKASKRFHTALVRYYEPGQSNVLCYREDTWGLVGLHIIQKTPSAPWLIWATFEQADNILDQNGKAVEDADGNVVNPQATPTSPALKSNPASPNPTVTFVDPASPYCTTPGGRLFFQENPADAGLPSAGIICVNKRWHDIPAHIIKINALAHQALKNYLGQNGISDSPWLYYKLVNVQPVPFDKGEIGEGGVDAATYYTANAVIETDYTLGVYSGRIANTGAPTDVNPDGTPYKNVRFLPFQGQAAFKTPLNMGGCTGCHASSALKGTEFSFSLQQSTVRAPELPNPFKGAQPLVRDRALFAPVQ